MTNKIRSNFVNAWASDRHHRLLSIAESLGRKWYWPKDAIKAEADNNATDRDLAGGRA